MKYKLSLLISLFYWNVNAQTIQMEINDQVWKPFCESLTSLDTATYLSVHAKELIRIERENKKIYGYDYYCATTKAGFEQSIVQSKKMPGIKFEVELRFLERIATDTLAYETGYYKSVLTLPDGRAVKYYSNFHVTLKKISDKWKIFVDSSLPLPQLTEDEFLKAKPMAS